MWQINDWKECHEIKQFYTNKSSCVEGSPLRRKPLSWVSLGGDASVVQNLPGPGGCFTNVSRALQDIPSKFVYYRNCTSYENFKLKLCTLLWAHVQSFSLKFSLKMWFLALYIFARLFWRARETLVKQHPDYGRKRNGGGDTLNLWNDEEEKRWEMI